MPFCYHYMELMRKTWQDVTRCYFSEESKLLLIEVMVWCHQWTNYYMKQCWPNHGMPYGITRLEWVEMWYTAFERAKNYIHTPWNWVNEQTGETCSWHRYTWTQSHDLAVSSPTHQVNPHVRGAPFTSRSLSEKKKSLNLFRDNCAGDQIQLHKGWFEKIHTVKPPI